MNPASPIREPNTPTTAVKSLAPVAPVAPARALTPDLERSVPSGTVYLLHFERPLHHARHYLGFSESLEQRLEDHRSGRGARLVEVFTELGIGFELVRTWPGDRHFERRLKRQKHAWRHCPKCRAERHHHLVGSEDGR